MEKVVARPLQTEGLSTASSEVGTSTTFADWVGLPSVAQMENLTVKDMPFGWPARRLQLKTTCPLAGRDRQSMHTKVKSIGRAVSFDRARRTFTADKDMPFSKARRIESDTVNGYRIVPEIPTRAIYVCLLNETKL